METIYYIITKRLIVKKKKVVSILSKHVLIAYNVVALAYIGVNIVVIEVR